MSEKLLELVTGAGAQNLPLYTAHRWRIVVPRVRVVRILEVEDVHFHYNSAVLLPDPHADENAPPNPNRITGLAVIKTALQFHRKHPDKRVLATGHTDTVGSQGFNLELSDRRAANVLAYVQGDRERWAATCQERFQVEDWQQILKWWARTRGWDCDPGPVDNVSGERSRAALRRFRARYGEEFGRPIPVKGPITPDDWRAFYDCYEEELARLLDCGVPELGAWRSGIELVEGGAVGCGESWPVEAVGQDNRRSALNRRVELLFFDAVEQPPLACHPGKACDKNQCVIYQGDRYRKKYLPVKVETYTDADLNLLVLEWADEVTPELPADLVLRLEAEGREPVEQAWASGTVSDGLRQFVFDEVPPGAACTLTAVSSRGTLVLLDGQIMDDPENPPLWSHTVDELRVADEPKDDAIQPQGAMPPETHPDRRW